MGDTKIQWTNKTWNPIRARNLATDERGWYCEHVSEGCRNCYAEKMNVNIYFGNGLPYKPTSLPQLELFLDEKILMQPVHWKKPQQVFVCSMTDLFASFIPDEWLDRVFATMMMARNHIFQVLTKRPERMRDYLKSRELAVAMMLDHVWLGVSVEDQKTADERIPLLLQTPAHVRWVSAEPLLESVKLSQNWCDYLAGWSVQAVHVCGGNEEKCYARCPEAEQYQTEKIDWVVVGGESGSGARQCDIQNIQSIVEQCRTANVPVFVKQLGSRPFMGVKGFGPRIADRKGGDISEFPLDLQVREYPKAKETYAT